MAANTEIKTVQKTALFDLLKLIYDNQKSRVSLEVGLKELIIKMKAAMDAEDVAYVEKIIAEL